MLNPGVLPVGVGPEYFAEVRPDLVVSRVTCLLEHTDAGRLSRRDDSRSSTE